MNLNSVNSIKNLIKFDQGLISLSNDFVVKDAVNIEQLLKSISEILVDLSKQSDKGYINNPDVDLPISRWLLKECKLRKHFDNTSFQYN